MNSAVLGAVKPYMVDAEPSALCTIGRPPIVLTGAILWVLRQHFADADNIVNAGLKTRIWRPGVEDVGDTRGSGIMIEAITRWPGPQTQTLQKRPAVLVKRNTYNVSRIGIGNRYQGSSTPSIDKSKVFCDYAIGSGTQYGVQIVGSHTMFCIGGTGAEAEELGTEVFFELLEFGPVIRQDLDLVRFDAAGLGALARLEESKENWVSPVVVSWVFNHDWVLRREGLPLKTVALSASP